MNSQSANKLGTVGLLNNLGEMNCFLNTVVQALWFLEDFRAALLSFKCPLTLRNCILCEIKELFQKMQAAVKQNSKYVEITSLRRKLAIVFESTGEFNIGSSADAMEVLMHILTALHCAVLNDKSQGADSDCSGETCKKTCPSHMSVGLSIVESIQCDCGVKANFEWDYCNFMHQFYVNTIHEESKQFDSRELVNIRHEEEFGEKLEISSVLCQEGKLGELLRQQWESFRIDACPTDNCHYKKSRKLLSVNSAPRNLLLNLIWIDRSPSKLEILQVLASIPLTLGLSQIYQTELPEMYQLKGIILYGHAHYIFFLLSEELWFRIDDDRYAQIKDGSWCSAIREMIDNKFHPTGLVYAETRVRSEFNISPIDWLRLEQYVLTKEKQDMDLVRTPSISPEVKQNNGYLTPNHIKLDNGSPLPPADNWKCPTCSMFIRNDQDVCTSCHVVKPGVTGWACQICTFLNKQSSIECKGCGPLSISQPLDSIEICKFCGNPNKSSILCSKCYNPNSSIIGWECKQCQKPNPDVKYSCWNCSAIKDQKVCERCFKSDAILGSSYCHSCEYKFCIKCKRHDKEPSSIYCRFCEPPPVHISPQSDNWVCQTCHRFNLSGEFCCSCRQYRGAKLHQCQICGTKRTSPFLCQCERAVKCSICYVKINSNEPMICSSCKINISTRECAYCESQRRKYNIICAKCTNKKWQCRSCNTMNSDSLYWCTRCDAQKPRSLPMSEARAGVSRSPKKQDSRCVVCSREPTSIYEKSNCCLCTQVRPIGCKSCGIEIQPYYLCDSCRRTSWVCIHCGSGSLKSKPRCSCGFTNTKVLENSFRV